MKVRLLIYISFFVLGSNQINASEQPYYMDFFTHEACRIDFLLMGDIGNKKIEFEKIIKLQERK